VSWDDRYWNMTREITQCSTNIENIFKRIDKLEEEIKEVRVNKKKEKREFKEDRMVLLALFSGLFGSFLPGIIEWLVNIFTRASKS